MMNTTQRAEELKQEGRELYAQGQFQEARRLFQEALAITPNDSDALNSLANTLCELNDGEWTDEAIAVLVESLKSNPENVKALNNLGDYHYRRGEFDEAIRSFEKAVAIEPNYSVAHVNLALAFRNTNRSQDALQALRTALSLDPSCTWTRFQLALTYLFRGLRFDDASDLEKAREVLISVSEAEDNTYPAERMMRVIDAYLVISKNQRILQRYLMESTQYFGDSKDTETFGQMLN